MSTNCRLLYQGLYLAICYVSWAVGLAACCGQLPALQAPHAAEPLVLPLALQALHAALLHGWAVHALQVLYAARLRGWAGLQALYAAQWYGLQRYGLPWYS